ncbi:hypothetical protein [Shinella lacus]|uniref:hypothetical protein n=1 Tax=Shinella lacus TaxID=2654216 RepID=UPI00210F1473|nr:hypothetical protein [Shinella lacus]
MAKFWPKSGLSATKVKAGMHLWLGAVQKETPAGEEIRRAFLVSIGNLGGGGVPILSGTLGGGDRRPTDERNIGWRRRVKKSAIGMAPMRRLHAFNIRRAKLRKLCADLPSVGGFCREREGAPCVWRK